MNMMYLPVAEGIDLSNPNSSLHLGYNDAHKAYNAKIKGRRPKMSLKIFKIFTTINYRSDCGVRIETAGDKISWFWLEQGDEEDCNPLSLLRNKHIRWKTLMRQITLRALYHYFQRDLLIRLEM